MDNRADQGPRRAHRGAPEPGGPDPYPRRPPADARVPDGGRRRAVDGPVRPDLDPAARGRHGVEDRTPVDRPAPRPDRTAVAAPLDAPDRPGGRRRLETGPGDHGRPARQGPGPVPVDDPAPGAARALVDAGEPVPDRAAGSPRPESADAGRPTRGRRGRAGRAEAPTTGRRKWRWAVAAAAAVAVVVPIALLTLGGSDDGSGSSQARGPVAIERSAESDGSAAAPAGDPADPAAPAASAATEVTFEVTGSGTVGVITYSRGSSVAQVSGVDLPWEQTAPAAEGPAEYSVSAAGASGEMSCRILVDDVVLAEETAGDYGAVSCSGRL
ncbi:MmpS family transport accessory protein [Pseudonocardia hydrocarbonoxydans]|uniref:MmpS family transport accessory protein n=1 Tax=Pseudonocardia hydrocarbonoxydans TaxID=76726 RepID=UPI00114319D1|nr:MmpS family transport accessory protein [Pseudonocardia hydrocarbonoxydans]